MPRDLPIGNGTLLVTFDAQYRIRDIYYPHVGSENQTAGRINRLGVWADGDFAWLDDPAWDRLMAYEPGTLVTKVEAFSSRLGLSLTCRDCVDADRPVSVGPGRRARYGIHGRRHGARLGHLRRYAADDDRQPRRHPPDRGSTWS